MKTLDYIIVGRGLAGSLLANELTNQGKKIAIISDESMGSSSLVAGGMFNPVTGKHLGKTWLADKLFPYFFEYYQALEKELQASFFHPIGVFRPFSNEENKAYFARQMEHNDLYDYLELQAPDSLLEQDIKSELGGLNTKMAGWVDIKVMLEKIKEKLSSKGQYVLNEFVDYKQIKINSERVFYKDFEAKAIIFCDGFFAKNNPWFSWLPFNPVKGETVIAEVENYNVTKIMNQGKWVMPLGKNKVRLGATYSWHRLDFENTDEAREELISKTGKFLKRPVKVLGQQAGVRPSTTDRRPFFGVHPKEKNVFCFNGLGTKGVSIAPFFVEQFLGFLSGEKDIHPEANIERFYSLFS